MRCSAPANSRKQTANTRQIELRISSSSKNYKDKPQKSAAGPLRRCVNRVRADESARQYKCCSRLDGAASLKLLQFQDRWMLDAASRGEDARLAADLSFR